MLAQAFDRGQLCGLDIGEGDDVDVANRAVAVTDAVHTCALGEHEGVVTGSADERVVACATHQRVVALATVEGVVAGPTADAVVAGQTMDRIIASGQHDDVVAGACPRDLGLDGGDVPHGAVAEDDLLDLVAASRVEVEEAFHDQHVRCVGEADEQMVSLTVQHHIGRSHVAAQADDIELASRTVVARDRVATMPLGEEVGVAAGSAHQGIVACTAIERVVAGAARQVVIAILPQQAVVARVTIQRVVLGSTAQQVITVLARDTVVTGTAIERVVAGAAVERVVTCQARERIGRGIAGQHIALRRRGRHLGLDRSHVPDDAIGKFDLLDLVAVGSIVVEVAADAQAVGCALDTQQQVIARARQHNIHSCDASAQLNHILLSDRPVVVVDGVIARALTEEVGVIARVGLQGVVASTTIQRVVARTAREIVIAILAQQAVVARVPVQRVVLGTTTQQVITLFTRQAVLPASSIERIVAGPAVQGVVTGGARERIGRRIPRQAIVAHSGCRDLGLDRSHVPDGAIGKLDLFDLVAVGCIAIEVIADAQTVRRAFDGQHKIVA